MWWWECNLTHHLHCCSAFQACVSYFALYILEFYLENFYLSDSQVLHTLYPFSASASKAHLHATACHLLIKLWAQWVICLNFYWEEQGSLGLQRGCKWDAKRLRRSWQTYGGMWNSWRRSFTRRATSMLPRLQGMITPTFMSRNSRWNQFGMLPWQHMEQSNLSCLCLFHHWSTWWTIRTSIKMSIKMPIIATLTPGQHFVTMGLPFLILHLHCTLWFAITNKDYIQYTIPPLCPMFVTGLVSSSLLFPALLFSYIWDCNEGVTTRKGSTCGSGSRVLGSVRGPSLV